MVDKTIDLSELAIEGDLIETTEYIYGQIFQNLPGAFYICDKDGRIVFYNAEAELLWGRKPLDTDLWCGSWRIYSPLDKSPLSLEECPMAITLKTAQSFSGQEILIEKPNGAIHHVSVSPRPIFDLKKELVGAFNILVDITERKQAEKLVKDNEQFLQSMFSSSHDCIKVLDLEGHLISMNEAGQRLAEIDDVTSFIGTSYIELWSDSKEEATQALEDARCGGTGRFVGSLLTVKTKTPKWWDIMITPIPGTNKRAERLLVVARDITEYSLLQEELKERNKELLRINADLDNFIYTASHDLRSPITNIEGLVNVLKKTLTDDRKNVIHEATDMLAMIDKSINRFKRTILDLTEISKVQRTNEEDIYSISCSEIIDDVILSIQDKINESGADIHIDVESCNSVIFSTKNFKSIVYNLLSNAVKYRYPGRKSEIQIRTQRIDDYILLSVQDNGLGIDSSHMPKLFSMFKRFHDHVEGTGIGLYIIKRIIDNAGGKIEVKSVVNTGTTFNVYLKQ